MQTFFFHNLSNPSLFHYPLTLLPSIFIHYDMKVEFLRI